MPKQPPEFKKGFVEKYTTLLGSETKMFLDVSTTRLPGIIRVNTLRTRVGEVEARLKARGWTVKNMPFYAPALRIEKRDMALGNTLEHFLGYYYVQESASMLPPLFLEPQKGEKILDTSAAPGSKTTQMSQMMENTGVIYANEPNLGRISALRANAQRMGCKNIVITRMDATRMKKTEFFDRVLVDAPCSAVGAIRKNWDIIQQWNPHMGTKLSNLQKRILEGGVNACKPGGTIVYSTCTLEPEENEAVVDWALQNLPVEIETFKIRSFKTREGITSWENQTFDTTLKHAHRIYPQDNDSEGFFVARLIKQ